MSANFLQLFLFRILQEKKNLLVCNVACKSHLPSLIFLPWLRIESMDREMPAKVAKERCISPFITLLCLGIAFL